jgi:dethiobiotin synthase
VSSGVDCLSLFVTGTDTGIGKTVVSSILALKLGYRYWKPIQSGLNTPTDSEWVASRLGEQSIQKEVYRLASPLSPHASAQIDGVEIQLDRIVEKKPVRKTVIEGAGGVLVPLNRKFLQLDLIQRLSCPVVVVARSGLGTINHTLLTLEVLRSRRISVHGVVLVGDPNLSNREAIEFYGRVSVSAEIPYLTELDRESLLKAGSLFHGNRFDF